MNSWEHRLHVDGYTTNGWAGSRGVVEDGLRGLAQPGPGWLDSRGESREDGRKKHRLVMERR